MEDTNDVNQGDVSPDVAPEVSSTSGQESGFESSNQPEGAPLDEEGKQSRHVPYDRFKKVNDSYKTTQAELQRLAAERKQYEGAINLHNIIAKDPRTLRHVMDLIEGKVNLDKFVQPEAGKENQEIDFSQYDPIVKTLHDDLQATKKMLAEIQQQRESESQSSLDNYHGEIDDYFDSLLMKDGYMGEDRAETPLNALIQKSTLAELSVLAKDPLRPTRHEVDSAYKNVVAGLSHFEKHKLTKQVKTHDVPPSGTKQGSIPGKKDPNKMTEQDRINYWANLAS